MTDEELLSYISESSTMSKALDEYEGALDTHTHTHTHTHATCIVDTCCLLGVQK